VFETLKGLFSLHSQLKIEPHSLGEILHKIKMYYYLNTFSLTNFYLFIVELPMGTICFWLGFKIQYRGWMKCLKFASTYNVKQIETYHLHCWSKNCFISR
jgi:hypothetical protein